MDRPALGQFFTTLKRLSLTSSRSGATAVITPEVLVNEHDEQLEVHTQGRPAQAQHRETIPNERDLLTATAPVNGTDTPRISDTDRRPPRPSIVSNLGNELRQAIKGPTDQPSQDSTSRQRYLENAIIDAIVRSGVAGQEFLPIGQLPTIINLDAVKAELKECRDSIRKRIKVALSADSKLDDDDIERYAATVCPNPGGELKSYRKILAILVLIERPTRIRQFIDEGVSDEDLPLELVEMPCNSALRHMGHKTWDLQRRSKTGKSGGSPSPPPPLRCFTVRGKRWRNSTLRKFEENQWIMTAPFFAQDERKLLLPQAVLPFTSWEPIGHQGSFGRMFKAEIHPDHHGFQVQYMAAHENGDNQHSKRESVGGVGKPKKALERAHVFAVKKLFSSKGDQFRQEFEMLRRISPEQHPHLIALLATYEQHGEYYLIFPLAASDLEKYWRDNLPEKTPETVSWIAEQCRGLAGAVAAIHRSRTLLSDSIPTSPHHDAKSDTHLTSTQNNRTSKSRPRFLGRCRHGDIKPKNILWFPPSPPGHTGPAEPAESSVPPSPLTDEHERGQHSLGILKITDFGAAQLDGSGSTTGKSCTTQTTANYRAPEADLLDAYPPTVVIDGNEKTEKETDAIMLQVSTSYDIWSLGCVFLEFVAWFFDGGWKGVQSFLDQRSAEVDPALPPIHTGKFFVLDFSDDNACADAAGPESPFSGTPAARTRVGARVKPEVHQFIERIQKDHSSASCFFHDLLVLIRDEMLVVEEPGHWQHVEGSSRIENTCKSPRRKNAGEIEARLSSMVQQGKVNGDYFFCSS
ncbi:kinase-like domain containing protein [Rhypophila sp. PSN 637]